MYVYTDNQSFESILCSSMKSFKVEREAVRHYPHLQAPLGLLWPPDKDGISVLNIYNILCVYSGPKNHLTT